MTVGRLEETSAATPPPQAVETVAGLGLKLEAASSGDGLVVSEIEPGAAVADSGLRRGDVIITVNGKAVGDAAALQSAMEEAGKDGRPSTLFQIRRGSEVRFVVIPLSRG